MMSCGAYPLIRSTPGFQLMTLALGIEPADGIVLDPGDQQPESLLAFAEHAFGFFALADVVQEAAEKIRRRRSEIAETVISTGNSCPPRLSAVSSKR